MKRATCLLSLGTRAYDGQALQKIAVWAAHNHAHVTFVELDTIERINSDVLGDMPRPNDFQERVTSIDWPYEFDYLKLSELSAEPELVERIVKLDTLWKSDSHFDGLLRSQIYRSLHPRLRRIGTRNQRHPIVVSLAPYLIQEIALLSYLAEIAGIEEEITMHPHAGVRNYLAKLSSPWRLPKLASLKEDKTLQALVLDEFVVAIGDSRSVGPINLTLCSGEVIGLLGVNGSGKTTLLRGIGGHLPIRSGRLFVGDRQVNQQLAYDRGIATVFQDGGLFPDRSADENVRTGMDKARRGGSSQRANDAFAEFKTHFGYDDFWSQLPAQLSGGQKQLAAVARALAASPQVILLDEPSASLDHVRKRRLISLLKGYVTTHRCAAILISHDMEVLLALCDRFLVLGERGDQIADIPARDFVEKGRSMTAARILGLPNIFDTQVLADGTRAFTQRAITVTDSHLLDDDDVRGAYLPPDAFQSFQEDETAPRGIEIRGWVCDRVNFEGDELLFLREDIGDNQGDALLIRTRANTFTLGDSARARFVVGSEQVRLMTR